MARSWDADGKRNRLYGRKWQKLRGAFLAEHPLCSMCHSFGVVKVAEVVDHKTPHRGDEVLFWDQGNWQALCEHHHNSHKAKTEIRGYALEVGEDGWPLDPMHPANTGLPVVSGKAQPSELLPISVPVFLVCGSAGSGKTTWCKRQMQAGDVLIDFDEIDGEINRVARRASRLVIPILRERNRRLLDAAKLKAGRVFLPITGATAHVREWWRSKLGNVTVVMMGTSEQLSIERVMNDPARSRIVEKQVSLVRDWWKEADFERVDLTISAGGGGDQSPETAEWVPRVPNNAYLVSDTQPIDETEEPGFA